MVRWCYCDNGGLHSNVQYLELMTSSSPHTRRILSCVMWEKLLTVLMLVIAISVATVSVVIR